MSLQFQISILFSACQVDILKGEAERQRLQREELEDELHSVKYQMQNVENVDTDMKRFCSFIRFLCVSALDTMMWLQIV